jgi:sialate O-acetylesterase
VVLLAALLVALQVDVEGPLSDQAVLQRGRPCPIRGKAAPGARVRVSFAGAVAEGVAGADGRWSVALGPLEAGGPHELAIEAGGARKIFTDVRVGDVWLLAGGPEADVPVKAAPVAVTLTETRSAMLRFWRSPGGPWTTSAGDASALGFHFLLERLDRTGVAQGLLQATVGEDLSAERWMSQRALGLRRATRGALYLQRRTIEAYEAAMTLHLYETSKGRGAAAPAPTKAGPPNAPYTGLIAPLIPYALAGALWVPGETDVFQTSQQRDFLEALVTGWRQDWGQGDFPVAWPQLGRPRAVGEDRPGDSVWAEFREAQDAAGAALPNAGSICRLDLGDAPRERQALGKRLAAWVYAAEQGKPGSAAPAYEGMEIEGSRIRLRFKGLERGLEAEALKGFSISGEFRSFVAAQAKREGDTIVVWAEGVIWPAAVRYAWSDAPDVPLRSSDGIPVSPFRTDRWPRR